MKFFRVVYYDRDNRTFGISEIVNDDTAISDRTVALREQGRDVNVSTTDVCNNACNVKTVERLANEILLSLMDYTYNPNLRW